MMLIKRNQLRLNNNGVHVVLAGIFHTITISKRPKSNSSRLLMAKINWISFEQNVIASSPKSEVQGYSEWYCCRQLLLHYSNDGRAALT